VRGIANNVVRPGVRDGRPREPPSRKVRPGRADAAGENRTWILIVLSSANKTIRIMKIGA
jgi:hypothetical protein